MAGELQFSYKASITAYVLIRSPGSGGMIWRGSMSGFDAYTTGNYSGYPLSATQQGTASAYYTADFPSPIPAGVYEITAKQQLGGTPAESDPTVAVGEYQWNGSRTLGLSDMATSGQIARFLPTRITKGHMIQHLPLYFKSSADHISPLTSGIVSGQIARNSGAYGALQSGAFFERGQGSYFLLALTSGDTNADSIALLFTARGVSGGNADPLPMAFITQPSSGG